MRITLLAIVLLLVFTQISFCTDIVQISDTRNDAGQWINWIEQEVTWDSTIITNIPDHYPISTKAIQTWAFPVENGWIKATFSRTILGVYALRWSHDALLWSDSESVSIQKPGNPHNNK